MKKQLFLFVINFLVAAPLVATDAVSWLPKERPMESSIRLLECVYVKARLERCEEITSSSSDWEVSLKGDPDGHVTPYGTQYVYEYTFKAKRALQSAGVAVAFDRYNWSSDNYDTFCCV